ncbi:LLM class flavin-dependent oxidoreductase [Leucobacter weissii]|uniref:LLM class flavin-dependent oxidoreductase n=1 Tax=Leucobacter weissii TaxID=1983706 RepID=A0A939MR17_9MICO|nr:LLM class flavin-dependent oxidoreductase [Leucobacter weissii]
MRFGYWTPIFGGWLRNVEDEATPSSFSHLAEIARAAEDGGFDLTLVPELNLNDIKGPNAPALDAWSVVAALAAVTRSLELLVAIRPGFHNPALTAKQASTIDEISGGRLTLNVVSAWWEEEARQYGGVFTAHDDRYARSIEFVDVLRGLWTETPFSYSGAHYTLDGTVLEPKPSVVPRVYAGGESEAGRDAIARFADAYLTHGGTVEELQRKVQDLRDRRERAGNPAFAAFGMAGYAIVRGTEAEAEEELARITDVRGSAEGYASYQDFVSKSQLDTEVDLRDYSVSNRGLRPGFVGTPDQVAERFIRFADAGVSTFLLQFSPHLPELARFAEEVIPRVRRLEDARSG